MLINISSLMGDPGASREIRFSVTTLAGLEWDESVTQCSPLDIEATITGTGPGFLVRGEVSTDLELQCDRCLRRFRHHLVASLEEEYLPATSQDNDGGDLGREVDNQFAEVSVFHGDVVDITEAVREQLLLALPSKALCMANCLGLCSTCGKELNSGDCACQHDTIDPRLAQLARLLDDEHDTDSGDA
jgi:uncharacterized protein